jgi:Mor family transcriptional regulator
MIPQYLVEAYRKGRISRTKIAKMLHIPLPLIIQELRELGVPQYGQGVPLVGIPDKDQRNREIYDRFQTGVSTLQLKEDYFMSQQRIRDILEEERKKINGVLRFEPREYIEKRSGVPSFTIPDQEVRDYLDGKIGLDTIANRYEKSLREVHTAAKYQGLQLRHKVHQELEAPPKPVEPPKKKQEPLPKRETPRLLFWRPKPKVPMPPEKKDPKERENQKSYRPKPPKHKSLKIRLTEEILEPRTQGGVLPARNLDIYYRRQAGQSLSEIANYYSLSTDRIEQLYKREVNRLRGVVLDKIRTPNRVSLLCAVECLKSQFIGRQWYKGVEPGVYREQLAVVILVSRGKPLKLHERKFKGRGWMKYPIVLRHYSTNGIVAVYLPYQVILCHYCRDAANYDLTGGVLRHQGRASCLECYLEKTTGDLSLCTKFILPYRDKRLKPKRDNIPPSWDNTVRLWEDIQCEL